jgi:hypothetical protein
MGALRGDGEPNGHQERILLIHRYWQYVISKQRLARTTPRHTPLDERVFPARMPPRNSQQLIQQSYSILVVAVSRFRG